MISCLLYVCWGGLLIYPFLAEVKSDKNMIAGARSDGSTLTLLPKYSRLLDANELEKIKASPSVGTVYFYKKDSHEWIKDFLSKYDKSAGFLNAYGLPLGLVDCSGKVPLDLEEECSKTSDEIVYTYRQGKRLLELEVTTMFDVDSIMSNVLILTLMDEMPIVQTVASRQQLEHDHAGQKDIVFAYHSSVGTYESRVFMEIAYAYQDKYKFAMTSEPSTTADLQDAYLLSDSSDTPTCMIWVLYCRERYDVASGCRSVNYRGHLNLIDLATFFKRLDWPKVVHKSEGSKAVHPCELSDEVGCVIVLHSPATKEKADKVIDSLQYDLHGMAGLIVQHINSGSGIKEPQVIIQKPGGKNVTLDGKLELDVIESVIATHLLPDPEGKTEDTDTTDSEDTADASRIDDMVVQVAFLQRQSIGDVPHIPALTDKTFPAVAKGKNNKLAVVLFYIPFDAQGMVFLSPYQEAGRKLAALEGKDPKAHPLARVNCFDWTDVCQKENITSYPTIYIYRNGGKREQYRHALDTDALVRTVLLLQAEQPLMLKSSAEVTDFLNGQLPCRAYSDVDNLVLLKLSSSRKEMKTYKAVIRALETQMLFAIVGPDVKTNFLPSGGVLHKRPKDQVQPLETMTDNLDAISIIDFLQKGQFNFFPELTFMNFPALYARKQPFAILFYEPSLPGANDMQQSIVSLLQSSKAPNMIFCKMTVGDSNPEAKPLLLNYTQTEVLPAFTIVNHDKGEVYILQDKEMKATALLPWIQAVQNGEVVPSRILDKGEWKPPGQHYDFLALMDKEKRVKQNTKNVDPRDLTEYFPSEDDAEEQQDVEARSILLELQRSRLYSGKDRRMPASASGRQETGGSSKWSATSTVEIKKASKGHGRGHKHSEL